MKIFFSILTKGVLVALSLACSLLTSIIIYGQSFPLSRPLTIKWNYLSNEIISVSSVSGEDTIYVPLSGGRLISLRAVDGELIWQAELGGDMVLAPSVDAQYLYIASEANALNDENGAKNISGVLRALSRTSGLALWMKTFPKPLKGALAVNEQFVFANSIDGTIYAIDKRTGDLKWIVRSSHPLSSPISISGSRLYMGTDNGYLVSLDQKTGATLWRYRTPGIVRAPIVNFLNMIFFGTDNGFVYSISEDDAGVTKLWRNRAGTGVQSLNYTHKGILVATQDNFVMLFAQQHGKRLWKKQLPARLASPPLSGSDGALFAPIGEEACIALSLFDGRQINTLFIGKDNSVVASPLIVNDTLIVPTRMGLLAFAVSK